MWTFWLHEVLALYRLSLRWRVIKHSSVPRLPRNFPSRSIAPERQPWRTNKKSGYALWQFWLHIERHSGTCKGPWQGLSQIVNCPNVGCHHSSLREDMDEHSNSCEKALVDCPGCRKEVARSRLAQHERRKCFYSKIECPLGCGMKLPR